MGLSASQARFLELTARKSNVEYQAQRINFERTQLAEKSHAVSQEYNNKMSNRKMTYSFNTGEGVNKVDLTYNNYKNYMNQQLEGLSTTQQKMFLVSSSGNKIIVANEEDMQKIIDDNTNIYTGDKNAVLSAKEEYAKAQEEGKTVSQKIEALASITLDVDENGNEVDKNYSIVVNSFDTSDFMIAPDLDKVENFQKAIQDGVYYFATYDKSDDEDSPSLKTQEWDLLGGGAIGEEYDKVDDAAAQAEYDQAQSKIQSMDKKLELQLKKLESERDAIKTEMDGVQKVIDDNIEGSFKVFS